MLYFPYKRNTSKLIVRYILTLDVKMRAFPFTCSGHEMPQYQQRAFESSKIANSWKSSLWPLGVVVFKKITRV